MLEEVENFLSFVLGLKFECVLDLLLQLDSAIYLAFPPLS